MKNIHSSIHTVAVAIFLTCLTLIAACGGGGSSDMLVVNPPTFTNQFDLAVTSITFSTTQSGKIANLDVTVTNYGQDITSATGLNDFTSNIASTGFVFEPGTGTTFAPLQAYPTTSTPLHQLGTFTYRVSGYFPNAGATNVSFTVDSNNRLPEPIEANNTLNAMIAVTTQNPGTVLPVTLGNNFLVSPTVATISWSAPINGSYVVYYGTSVNNLNQSTGLITSATGSYQVNLAGLSAGQTYFYAIQSTATGQRTTTVQLLPSSITIPTGGPTMTYLPGATDVEIARFTVKNPYPENADLSQVIITPTCLANFVVNMKLVNAANNAVISPTLIGSGGQQWPFGSLTQLITANGGTYTLAVHADIISNAQHGATCTYQLSNVVLKGKTTGADLPAPGTATGNVVTIQ